MRSRRAAHVAGSHRGGARDLEGSGERIDMGWHHRVWRGTAPELLEQSRRLVRVTTANGCFMALRANGRSVRPACDRQILWQAHKARTEVDTIVPVDVKHWAGQKRWA